MEIRKAAIEILKVLKTHALEAFEDFEIDEEKEIIIKNRVKNKKFLTIPIYP